MRAKAPDATKIQIAGSLFARAVMLGEMNRSDEELRVYDQVVAQFGTAPELALREQVAMALVNKGITLGQLNRSDEAVVVYDQVVAQFGSAPELALREQVARVLTRIGISLILKAKLAWVEGEARAQLLAKSRSKFLDALEHRPETAVALGYLSYVLFLSGQRSEAIAPLKRGLELGGKELHQAIINDIATYPISDDGVFRELVENTWHAIQLKQSQ